jgi:hypothetical protein
LFSVAGVVAADRSLAAGVAQVRSGGSWEALCLAEEAVAGEVSPMAMAAMAAMAEIAVVASAGLAAAISAAADQAGVGDELSSKGPKNRKPYLIIDILTPLQTFLNSYAFFQTEKNFRFVSFHVILG